MKKAFTSLLLTTCLLNTTACGYFLYPERVGQKSGHIDPAIVILDAAGLLFGILPGVVAFAVDLTTGTIYLPPGGKSTIDKHTERLGMIDPKTLIPAGGAALEVNHQAVAERLGELLGHPVDASQISYYHSSHASISMVPAF